MMLHRPEPSILDKQDHHATVTFFSAKSRWFYLHQELPAALKNTETGQDMVKMHLCELNYLI